MTEAVPSGYVRTQRTIRVIDLAVLLHHVFVAAKNQDIGFEDANETLESLVKKVNKEVQIELPLLESALWSCNLLNEKDKFQHPLGRSFRQFVKGMFPNERFNEIYNMLEEGAPHE